MDIHGVSTADTQTPSDEPSLLGTLEQISRLVVSHHGNPAETLHNIALLLQGRVHSDVCSVYLLQPDRLHLVLAATVGLEPSSVGVVRMKLSEGLVGLVAECLAPQVIAEASTHPRFKFFPEAGESRYQSFLGVPMLERGLLVGVLVIQTIQPRLFTPDEVRVVAMAASQVAPIVSDARAVRETLLQQERLRIVQVTMRTVHDVVNNCLNQLQLLRHQAEGLVPDESLALFDEAVETASRQLLEIASIEVFAEKPMAMGAGLDWERRADQSEPPLA